MQYLFICIILVQQIIMKNAVLVSVWMKIAKRWCFAVLLVKLLSNLLVIHIKNYYFSEPTWYLLMTVFAIIMQNSVYILKIYNNIAVIFGNSIVNRLKVSAGHWYWNGSTIEFKVRLSPSKVIAWLPSMKALQKQWKIIFISS